MLQWWTSWWGNALKLAEICWRAPQVIAHRVTRMALAGPKPDARDRREFHGMVSEKLLAFSSGGWSMWLTFWLSAWRSLWSGRPAQAVHWQRALGRGIAPIHRKVSANAHRLAKTPLRLGKR
ncbi:hypothetical protein [Chitinolyticbacter meiyuanensis]|uniref:hypothetical protein n=1 Tax=Chitinolyticbacter meiyuanensis TaxID=682798 RepID=UPI0016527BDA|nr:hypothetical protein [Chitinolyticbacter meiyuanensis]